MSVLPRMSAFIVGFTLALQVSIQSGCSSQKRQLRDTAKIYYKEFIKLNFDATYKMECPLFQKYIPREKYLQGEISKERKVAREWEIKFTNDHLTEELFAKLMAEKTPVKTTLESISVESVTIESDASAAVNTLVVYRLPSGQKKELPYIGNWYYEDGKWCHTEDWPYGWEY